MKQRKSSLGRSRDFGTEGAGKGDADRVSDQAAFGKNFSKIEWPVVAVEGFKTVGVKQVKTYGATPKKEWVVHPDWVNSPYPPVFYTADGVAHEINGFTGLTPPKPFLELEDFEIWDR